MVKESPLCESRSLENMETNISHRILQLVDDVEEFINDLDLANIAVANRASDIKGTIEKDGIWRQKKKDVGTLASELGNAIADYKTHRYQPIQLRFELAQTCMYYIEIARTHNVIEYPNLSAKAQKFDEQEKEHEKLKSDQDKLLKKYNELLKENKKLAEDNKILHGFDGKDNKRKGDGFLSGGLDET